MPSFTAKSSAARSTPVCPPVRIWMADLMPSRSGMAAFYPVARMAARAGVLRLPSRVAGAATRLREESRENGVTRRLHESVQCPRLELPRPPLDFQLNRVTIYRSAIQWSDNDEQFQRKTPAAGVG